MQLRDDGRHHGKFRGHETVAAEHVRELGEELLDLRQCREVGSTAESRLRGWRGMEKN